MQPYSTHKPLALVRSPIRTAKYLTKIGAWMLLLPARNYTIYASKNTKLSKTTKQKKPTLLYLEREAATQRTTLVDHLAAYELEHPEP